MIGPIVTILFSYWGSVWQKQVHELVGMTSTIHTYMLLALVLTMVTALLLLGIGRSIRRLGRWIIGLLDRILPRRISVAAGVLILILLLWWIYSGIFVNFFETTSDYFIGTTTRRRRKVSVSRPLPYAPEVPFAGHMGYHRLSRPGFRRQGPKQGTDQRLYRAGSKKNPSASTWG